MEANTTSSKRARMATNVGDEADEAASASGEVHDVASEPTLAYALSDSPLSNNILRHLSFISAQTLRGANRQAKSAVTAHLDRYPSMVIIGGLHIDLDTDSDPIECEISKSVRAFRPATMQWYTLPSLNEARFCAAACSLPDGRIFVAGGVDGFNRNVNNAVANQGVFVEDGRIMRGQPEHERGWQGHWRGRNASRGTMTNTVEMLDPETATWSMLARLPRGEMAGARACLDETGTKILLIGGTRSAEDFESDYSRDVDVFDLETNDWIDDTIEEPAFPPMKKARSEFVLTRVPGKGIFVAGGTNRFLWPNSPLTAEFYDFKTKRWEVLDPPPTEEYADEGVVATTEELGGDCALLEGNRYVVVYGGMHIESEYEVPRGWGNEDNDTEDASWTSDDGEYDKRLQRPFRISVYDVDERRWLTEEGKSKGAFKSMERARTGATVWSGRGKDVFIAGGNYEFYGEHNMMYPSHGSTNEIYLIDGPQGKRLRLPWKKNLHQTAMAASVVSLDLLHSLAEKHGWQDLRQGAEVELHNMKTESYNGRRGWLSEDIGEGRWSVILEGQGKKKKPVGIKVRNIRVL